MTAIVLVIATLTVPLAVTGFTTMESCVAAIPAARAALIADGVPAAGFACVRVEHLVPERGA